MDMRFLSPKKIIAVEIVIEANSLLSFHALEITIQNNSLKTKSLNGYDDISKLDKAFIKEIPVCLILTGKGILLKQVETKNPFEKESVFRQVLPFANLSEYAIDFGLKKENPWVSVMRNDQMIEIYELIRSKGISVLDLFIGPLALEGFLSLDHSFKLLQSRDYTITIEGNSISHIEKSRNDETTIEIAGQSFSSYDLVTFAAGYTFLLINNCSTHNELTLIKQNADEYKLNFALKKVSILGISLLFVLLIVNFVLFSKYNRLVNTANQKVYQTKTLEDKKNKLIDDLKKRTDLLSNTGMNQSASLTHYADIIASTRPDKLYFSVLNINPVEINQFEQSIKIQKKIITIEGSSKSAEQINSWIKKLTTLQFVKSVDLVDLKTSNTDNSTEFKLMIKVR